MTENIESLLIIRLSSLGDILQCSPLPTLVRRQFPNCRIVWLTRSDFRDVVEKIRGVDEVWSIDRDEGVQEIYRTLKKSMGQFSHIYDAHNNLRSNLLVVGMRGDFRRGLMRPDVLQFSKRRWERILFFKFRKPVFPTPYRASVEFAKPLAEWGIDISHIDKIPSPLLFPKQSLHPKGRLGLVPGAAWQNKIWPVESYLELIRSWKLTHPECEIIVLGGKDDEICFEIERSAQVKNLAGKLRLTESIEALTSCNLVIGSDTGLLQAADQLEIPNIFIIGPSAFGYPVRATSHVAEIELPCKPCSKDGRTPCTNSVLKKCLVDLKPAVVLQKAQEVFAI